MRLVECGVWHALDRMRVPGRGVPPPDNKNINSTTSNEKFPATKCNDDNDRCKDVNYDIHGLISHEDVTEESIIHKQHNSLRQFVQNTKKNSTNENLESKTTRHVGNDGRPDEVVRESSLLSFIDSSINFRYRDAGIRISSGIR